MHIGDIEQTRHYLKFVGYYRLSGYFRVYCDPTDQNKERFLPGSTFQSVLDLYVFDRKIHVLLLGALERIEVAVKSEMSNNGALNGKEDAFWLNCPATFVDGRHDHITKILSARLSRRLEDTTFLGLCRLAFCNFIAE
jgi:abortive infection bacteriophage resistance protein